MKKKILATLLLSSIVLSNFGNVVIVKADDTDSQIAVQENKISEISAKQATAQAEVDKLQSQVDTIRAEQDKLTAENEKLEAESKALSAEIEQLAADIVSRDGALKEQARSAQTDASATSYINTILDSKSIVDAISRVNAMREIVSANNRMLEKQKADKEVIAKKQQENQKAINTVWDNQKKLADDAEALKAQEAALKAAQLSLAAEKETAEGKKAELLEQKAAAEAAAKAAAAAQAAYQAKQAAVAQQQQQQPVVTAVAATPVASTPAPAPAQTNTVATPVPTPAPAPITYSSAGNTYPVGECTWGAKQAAGWVGNYWGNANMWPASARAAGFRVGSTPAVGAVAVWPYDGGGYGHVAVVTAVNGAQIQVVESNYAGNRYVSNFRGWFNPTAGTWGGSVMYIYPN
ncbi:peptidoglycan hydrolase PcsB [Streptococcus ovis]|uniref:peptidoglycan hydrolase PcsB n=1 Tax=Streptococcus ovis TaxID=82806 RepID=UPI000380EAC4|nr:CHAP domain-containing protein [Streptococcus ovis]